ncbi:MAG: hypothetical protein HY892_11070 [Deltaproteobacteria bacterium]|nr:hypothetical protein [Deltaproteobacteria bacterium]
MAITVRKHLKTEAGLGLVVEPAETGQWLRLGYVRGKKSETYEHKIGGSPATLPERVTVMALDWLRKKLISRGSQPGTNVVY